MAKRDIIPPGLLFRGRMVQRYGRGAAGSEPACLRRRTECECVLLISCGPRAPCATAALSAAGGVYQTQDAPSQGVMGRRRGKKWKVERWSAEEGGIGLPGDPTDLLPAPEGRAPRLACRAPRQDSPPGPPGAVPGAKSRPSRYFNMKHNVKFCAFIKRTHLEALITHRPRGTRDSRGEAPSHRAPPKSPEAEAAGVGRRVGWRGLFLVSVSFAKHGDKSAQAPTFEAIGPKQVDV
ncbi:unnamed protein product [Boreogadus saida]